MCDRIFFNAGAIKGKTAAGKEERLSGPSNWKTTVKKKGDE